ncbi:hypothetical protein RKE29_07730 [Streptomyces sp. B1866]|uniref:DODA-type extradiol aromatic ring-opening family dioxygenase n=1 Tax=Streptomyces sp. B1866 TaxID=3075431 RepID=UPI00288C6C8A|nr:hypothetical protein [Streptomyces sp. B1866]MDT3396531.1 hypothetical protein [Streptomyces sp. B1866]
MARVVAAFAASHAPMMLAATDSAPREQAERFTGALTRAARRVREAGAQAVVMLSNEHFTNFFLENFPQACIGLAERHTGPAEPWLPIPRGTVPGHAPLARALADGLLGQRWMPSFSQRLDLDHGVMTIYHALAPDGDLPLVPILQNCAVAPMLPLPAWYDFGRALARAIDACPDVDRVAVVAAGGLSHSIGDEHTGDVDDTFDRWFLQRLARGALDDVLDLPDEELEQAGNGAHEIRSWLALAGAVDGPVTVTAYEPIRAWLTGMAVAEWDLAAPEAVR